MDYGTKVEPLDWNQSGESTIIQAARACYDSYDKSTPESDDKLIRKLIESGHHSVLEFGWAAFRIRCSRVVSHELVRHRLFSIAMRSQRYVDESRPDYIIPPELHSAAQPEYAMGMYEKAMQQAWSSYSALLKSGLPRQIARYALPSSTATIIILAGNFRQWMHFCQLRCSPKCQPEMRQVANDILRLLKELAPRVFADIEHTN